MAKSECLQCGMKIGGFFGPEIHTIKRGSKIYNFCSEDCCFAWRLGAGSIAKPATVIDAKNNKPIAVCWECHKKMLAEFGIVADCPSCNASNIIPKEDGGLPSEAEIGLNILEELGRIAIGEED